MQSTDHRSTPFTGRTVNFLAAKRETLRTVDVDGGGIQLPPSPTKCSRGIKLDECPPGRRHSSSHAANQSALIAATPSNARTRTRQSPKHLKDVSNYLQPHPCLCRRSVVMATTITSSKIDRSNVTFLIKCYYGSDTSRTSRGRVMKLAAEGCDWADMRKKCDRV
jgi:hypothetical protein